MVQVAPLSAVTSPASTFAVVLTTEQAEGVSDVATTVDTRDIGTLIYERCADVSRDVNLVRSPSKLEFSFGVKVFSSSQVPIFAKSFITTFSAPVLKVNDLDSPTPSALTANIELELEVLAI
jgi:hypothetical protein